MLPRWPRGDETRSGGRSDWTHSPKSVDRCEKFRTPVWQLVPASPSFSQSELYWREGRQKRAERMIRAVVHRKKIPDIPDKKWDASVFQEYFVLRDCRTTPRNWPLRVGHLLPVEQCLPRHYRARRDSVQSLWVFHGSVRAVSLGDTFE